jgi:hypothetical protein
LAEEKKKTKSQAPLIGIIGSLLLLVIFMGVMYVRLNIKYNKDIAESNEIIQKFDEQNKELQTNLSSVKDVTDSYRSRLEGIKDKDDLLKRDIFVYVDTKYVEIPKSVAIDIAENIVNLSKKYNISPELIVGIIQVESSFNPMAVSSKKARGLMQVMPEWVKKIDGVNKITDLHDIDTNINTGVQVLLIHIEESNGSLSKGLYHYVGKSTSYVDNVYRAIGEFVAFRSTIDDNKISNKSTVEEEKGEELEPEQGTAENS